MRIRLSRVFLLSPTLLLAACAGTLPVHQSLPDAARDKIASTEVVIPIRQSEIYVYVPPSNITASSGGAGGLLGVLVFVAIDASVDSVRTSKAETAVKPLRDSLVDFDFDTALRDDVNSSLSQIAWLHVDKVHVVKEVSPTSLDSDITNSKDAAVMLATTDYNLSNDAGTLTITLSTGLFPKTDDLKSLVKDAPSRGPKTAPQNALYRTIQTYVAVVPGRGEDRDHNIASWNADHGAAMRDALKKGCAELSKGLADDLQGLQVITTGEKGSTTYGR